MREMSQVVRIEKHQVEGDLVALTFADPSPADGQRPLVVVLHGLGSRKERHLDLCLRLAEAGFLACAIDARAHGDRATPEMRRRLQNRESPEFAAAFEETVAGTVKDVTNAVSYIGTAHYALIGHSMGGFIALQAARADARAAVVTCVAGALDLSAELEMETDTATAARASAFDPVVHAASFWPRPLLLIHGECDETVPIRGARRLYQALQPIYASGTDRLALKIFPDAGHDLLPEMADAAVAWTVRFFPPDAPERIA